MSNKCKVSIYCTAYNHENYIRDALDGFLAQKTDFPFEVLVTDDASTDGTTAILREYQEKYPGVIRFFHQEKNLFSQGINIYEEVMYPNTVAYRDGKSVKYYINQAGIYERHCSSYRLWHEDSSRL